MTQFRTGLLVISLDFELYWGVRDKRSIESYRENLENTRKAVLATLDLFDTYRISATWSTVGFLFHESRASLEANLPEEKPSYGNQNLCPYRYLQSEIHLEPELHFAPDLIKTIAKTPRQEIGSHTYSHFYCLEKEVTLEQFRADLELAIEQSFTGAPQSLVFPRNQWREDFLATLKESGFRSFRGVEKHPIYQASSNKEQGYWRRAWRLLDSYVNLTGHHTFSYSDCGESAPYNIRASRFLRPYSRKLAFLDPLRKRRIVKSMRQAARTREAYHLWWHPHNFGKHLNHNLSFLRELLEEFTELRKTHQMESVSMEGLAEMLSAEDSGAFRKL